MNILINIVLEKYWRGPPLNVGGSQKGVGGDFDPISLIDLSHSFLNELMMRRFETRRVGPFCHS